MTRRLSSVDQRTEFGEMGTPLAMVHGIKTVNSAQQPMSFAPAMAEDVLRPELPVRVPGVLFCLSPRPGAEACLRVRLSWPGGMTSLGQPGCTVAAMRRLPRAANRCRVRWSQRHRKRVRIGGCPDRKRFANRWCRRLCSPLRSQAKSIYNSGTQAYEMNRPV